MWTSWLHETSFREVVLLIDLPEYPKLLWIKWTLLVHNWVFPFKTLEELENGNLVTVGLKIDAQILWFLVLLTRRACRRVTWAYLLRMKIYSYKINLFYIYTNIFNFVYYIYVKIINLYSYIFNKIIEVNKFAIYFKPCFHVHLYLRKKLSMLKNNHYIFIKISLKNFRNFCFRNRYRLSHICMVLQY